MFCCMLQHCNNATYDSQLTFGKAISSTHGVRVLLTALRKLEFSQIVITYDYENKLCEY